MVYRRDLYLGLCSLTYIFVIYFLRTIVLNSQTLLMIPLLTNVNLHLIKSWITLKQMQENCLNVSVSSTWKQMLLIVICLFLVMNLFAVNIKGSIIESSNCEKLRNIYSFSFEYYINRIFRKSKTSLV